MIQTGTIAQIPQMNEEENTPLSNKWVFWYLIPNKSGPNQDNNWKTFLHPLYSFNFLNDFYRLIKSVERPSKLLKGCRYYIFRENVQPLWEDPQLIRGKIGYIEFQKDNEKNNSLIAEKKFYSIVSSVLTSDSPYSNSLLGVEFNSRPNTWKIAIWVNSEIPNLSDLIQLFNMPEEEITFEDITADQ